jgi:hypothetical protein
MKRFANWNACYSCGFDVANGHTSQTCPLHLRKPDNDKYFTQKKCPAIHQCGVWMQHKNAPQDGVSNNVMVRDD